MRQHLRTFASGNYCAYGDVRSYMNWYAYEADFGPVFQFHRWFLEHLQARYACDRWALKSPENTNHPEAMVDAYPDGIFVQTHRDPLKVQPSLVSLITALHRAFGEPDAVDPVAIGRSQLELNVQALERTWQVRQRPSVRDQFYDVHFDDLVQRPLETVEKLYAHFDLALSQEAKAEMKRYVEDEAARKHGHGRHSYSLGEFGYTRAQLEESFRPYAQRHNILMA